MKMIQKQECQALRCLYRGNCSLADGIQLKPNLVSKGNNLHCLDFKDRFDTPGMKEIKLKLNDRVIQNLKRYREISDETSEPLSPADHAIQSILQAVEEGKEEFLLTEDSS